LHKILIANRGEIAVRVMRTCREMGLATVAVYSDCDRAALHVRMADEAVRIGPDRAAESYLRIDTLIDAAHRTGADAVHPGYGFLSENPEFAVACRDTHLKFIGPSVEAMRLMGSKTAARKAAIRAGVPVAPGTETLPPDLPESDVARLAETVGYPLLIKAAAGGGGKGMRTVREASELLASVAVARSEAQSAFGDSSMYFEKLVDRARHIEVQILADSHGNVVPFTERECSIQRRHQKLIEETPSTAVTEALRVELTTCAAAIARAAAYEGAGTVEFLLDSAGRFFFLEMNTRLQVEHPITEAITGLDLVRAQIEIRDGATITESPAVRFASAVGHAIECRIYAEDAAQGFLPSPGTITHLRPPAGPGIRDDSGVYEGWVVSANYDPLLSKVIAWGPTRAVAIARMQRALAEYDIRGITTTIGFCKQVTGSAAFRRGHFNTGSIDQFLEEIQRTRTSSETDELVAAASALYFYREDARAAGLPGGEAEGSLWSRQARLEGLR